MIGVKRTGDITLSGVWDDVSFTFVMPASAAASTPDAVNVCISPRGRRLFWVNWHPETFSFTASLTGKNIKDGEGNVEASVLMQPIGAITVIPAEWWRRTGYQVIDAIARCWMLVKGAK